MQCSCVVVPNYTKVVHLKTSICGVWWVACGAVYNSILLCGGCQLDGGCAPENFCVWCDVCDTSLCGVWYFSVWCCVNCGVVQCSCVVVPN